MADEIKKSEDAEQPCDGLGLRFAFPDNYPKVEHRREIFADLLHKNCPNTVVNYRDANGAEVYVGFVRYATQRPSMRQMFHITLPEEEAPTDKKPTLTINPDVLTAFVGGAWLKSTGEDTEKCEILPSEPQLPQLSSHQGFIDTLRSLPKHSQLTSNNTLTYRELGELPSQLCQLIEANDREMLRDPSK